MRMVMRGTIQNGYVGPCQPLELRNGDSVYIVSIRPANPQRRNLALARLRDRAVGISLPDEAFTVESLYED